MRKLMLLLVSLIILVSLTGCWSRVELNDVAIVTGTAIDLAEDDRLELSLQILKVKMTKGISEKGGSGESATLIVSGTGESILDAYQTLQKKMSRIIIFSHNRVVIVGDKFARAGITPVLEFFSRHREARGTNYLLTTKGEAKDVLMARPNFEIFAAEEIREEEKALFMDSATIRGFIFCLLEKGIEPMSTQIQIVPLSNSKSSQSQSDQSGFGVVGVGIFNNDKLIGWMKRREAETLLWLQSKAKNAAVLTATLPDEKTSTEKISGKISAQLYKIKTKIKPIIQGEKISFNINLQMSGELFENTTKLSFTETESLKKAQQALEREAENRVMSTLDQLKKKYKSDVIGFGTYLHRANKKAWNENYSKRWQEVFPNVEFHTNVQFEIVGTGRVNDSMLWDEEKKEK
ncbi:Ger(x)C family spore germination protein [Paenibacillus sp. GCM10012306]|uniref:Ger(x)C family spore germination protein n=1 Tax=Paenibacillus sp. GCM10012306 TaxID=3317342 RepID=UPI0036228F91